MSVEQFIKQIAAGQTSDATETLTNVLSNLAFEALDNKKQEVAHNIFNFPVVEEETLTELDKSTLSNYITKSAGSYGYNMRTGELKKAAKRLSGSFTAQKKIIAKQGQTNEEALSEASLTAGKRLVHKVGEGIHTAKVYHDKDYNEYQAHFYKNGKHMGEGPVSYHDDKEDAINSVNAGLEHMNSKN